MNINQLVDTTKRWFVQNSPRILTSVGIGSMLASVIFAVKETPKAVKRVEEVKKEHEVSRLSAVDVIKCTWKYYIPTALMFISGTGCIVAATVKQEQRTAASAALCSVLERSYAEYRQSTLEKVGERKEAAIRADMNQKRIDADPPQDGKIYQQSKNGLDYICECPQEGKTLCYFPIRPGRYFYCKIEDIQNAVAKLNADMSTSIEPYVSLDDFFYECNLPPFDERSEGNLGRMLGWNLFGKNGYGFIKIEPTHGQVEVIFKNNGFKGSVPCEIIDFAPGSYPDYGYARS